MKNSKYIFLVLIFVFKLSYGQQTKTVTINYSKKQGIEKDCGFSSCNYFTNFGERIQYKHSPTSGSETLNARYFFNHPGFKNSKITKIILELKISKILGSTGEDTGMYIRMPKHACNDEITWSGFPDKEKLYICIQNGTSIFNAGIGTNSTSSKTYNLLIYDKEASGFPSQTIKQFKPDSESFTFAFVPRHGGTKIHGAKVKITYESDAVNPPVTPNLTATVGSSTSIKLSWNNVANATSYEVYNCTTSNSYKVKTTSATNFTVTGLTPSTRYAYKVRAVNASGTSSFSTCKSVTTSNGNGGGCVNVSNIKPPRPSLAIDNSNVEGIYFTWNTSVKYDAYRIYRCETNKLIEEVKAKDIAQGNYHQYWIKRKNLEPGQKYSIKIKGVDYCNNTSAYVTKYSSCSSVYNVPCKGGKVDKNKIKIYSYYSDKVRINWKDVNPPGNYDYQIYLCNGNQNALLTTTYNNSQDWLYNLNPSTEYSIKIRTVSCGNTYGDFSDCFTFKTLSGCGNSEPIVIQNKTISADKKIESSNDIELKNVKFKGGIDVVVKAQDKIKILSGTVLESGVKAVLKIEACTGNKQEQIKVIEDSSLEEQKLIANIATDEKKQVLNPKVEEVDNVLKSYKFEEKEKELNELGVNLFPNPANTYISISLEEKFVGGKITLLNTLNKVIWEKPIKSSLLEKINVKMLASGVYMLKITKDNEVVSQKLLKK